MGEAVLSLLLSFRTKVGKKQKPLPGSEIDMLAERSIEHGSAY